MEKKRSAGVTVFAVLFIFTGLINSLSILNLAIWNYKNTELTPVSFREMMLNSNSKVNQEARKGLDEVVNDPYFVSFINIINDLRWSPVVFRTLLFQGFLGLISIFVGVGIWRLKEWGRKLMFWFGVAMTFVWPFFLYFMINESMRIVTKHIQEAEAQIESAKSYLPFLFIGGGILISLIIDGLIIYYFTRPKVKEQFS